MVQKVSSIPSFEEIHKVVKMKSGFLTSDSEWLKLEQGIRILG